MHAQLYLQRSNSFGSKQNYLVSNVDLPLIPQNLSCFHPTLHPTTPPFFGLIVAAEFQTVSESKSIGHANSFVLWCRNSCLFSLTEQGGQIPINKAPEIASRWANGRPVASGLRAVRKMCVSCAQKTQRIRRQVCCLNFLFFCCFFLKFRNLHPDCFCHEQLLRTKVIEQRVFLQCAF